MRYKIAYNLLNLPEKITLSNGNVIRYVYAADGRKLTAKYKVSNIHAIDDPIIGPLGMTGLLGSGAAGGMNGGGMVVDDDSIPGGFTPGGGNILPGGGTPLPLDSLDQVTVGEDMLDHANTRRRIDYCGSYIYKNGTLDKVLFDGGYIDRDGGYNYFIKDYQGNVRMVVNEQDSVLESDNYYPYGQLFTEGAPSGYSAQPWKYGGKELDREHGINEHDFVARRQMPQLGLFSTQDPLKWDNPDVSPYLYCAANPIRFTDPTGSYIVGTDGKRVTFQNETWSKNASKDVQRIGNSMMLTSVGTKVLSDMLNCHHPITLRIDNYVINNKFGQTNNDFTRWRDNQGIEFRREFEHSEIIIFMDNWENKLSVDPLYKNLDILPESAIGTIATHEGIHATNLNANSTTPGVKSDDAEKMAMDYEINAINELIMIKDEK